MAKNGKGRRKEEKKRKRLRKLKEEGQRTKGLYPELRDEDDLVPPAATRNGHWIFGKIGGGD